VTTAKLEFERTIARVTKAIAKRQSTVREIDQENLVVTQNDRSVRIKINQNNQSDVTTDFK